MTKKQIQKNTVIYQGKSGEIKFREDFKGETIWGSLNQIAELFLTDKSGISRHIRNIYKTGELAKKSTVAKIATVQKEGKRQVTREIEYYNLDMILSVGYRVNSKQATAFRIWATKTLKTHLLRGYTINRKRLERASERFAELQETISFLEGKAARKSLKDQGVEILSLLNNYSKSLTLLEQYDKNSLKKKKGKESVFVLDYAIAREVLDGIKDELIKKKETTALFAAERSGVFKGIIRGLYQSFGNKELYGSVEEKAAHLFYFTIKDHPFTDGNKRSAAFLFVYFLDKNNYLYKKSGEKKINDNALTALALLIAESDPKEKAVMIRLIINLISE